MKSSIPAAVAVLITFAINVVSTPLPTLPANLCVGEDCAYSADSDDAPYLVAASKIGKHNYSQQNT
jgi:hypothetical protein